MVVRPLWLSLSEYTLVWPGTVVTFLDRVTRAPSRSIRAVPFAESVPAVFPYCELPSLPWLVRRETKAIHWVRFISPQSRRKLLSTKSICFGAPKASKLGTAPTKAAATQHLQLSSKHVLRYRLSPLDSHLFSDRNRKYFIESIIEPMEACFWLVVVVQ